MSLERIKSVESTVSVEKIKNKKKNSDGLVPYLFIAPQIALFLVFFIIPAIIGIYAAFTKWDIFSTIAPQFTGFDNLNEIFFNKESSYYRLFWIGLKSTVTFVIFSVPFCIVIPLFMAMALNAKPKFYKFFQSVFYLPSVFSISTVVLIWYFLFNKNLGFINNTFHTNINWLGKQPFTWTAIIIITVWWTIGTNMVIYLAAMAGISKEILESADIDGAGPIAKFFKVILPSIKNQLVYTIVLTTIAQFNVYGQPLMLTEGAPRDTTRVLIMVIRAIAFPSNGGKSVSGIASAMVLILGIIIMTVALIQYKFSDAAE